MINKFISHPINECSPFTKIQHCHKFIEPVKYKRIIKMKKKSFHFDNIITALEAWKVFGDVTSTFNNIWQLFTQYLLGIMINKFISHPINECSPFTKIQHCHKFVEPFKYKRIVQILIILLLHWLEAWKVFGDVTSTFNSALI